jgi:hypothetical protein
MGWFNDESDDSEDEEAQRLKKKKESLLEWTTATLDGEQQDEPSSCKIR